MKLDDAIARAKDVGLDLIEVSPNAKPPVAKILNYGKLKYEEKKKQQASKKKQHVVKVKEIRVRPRIDTHDLETKVNLGRKFIRDGCKLKVTLMYRGRELSRTDLGLAVLDRVREMFSDIAEVEKEGSLEGRRQTDEEPKKEEMEYVTKQEFTQAVDEIKAMIEEKMGGYGEKEEKEEMTEENNKEELSAIEVSPIKHNPEEKIQNKFQFHISKNREFTTRDVELKFILNFFLRIMFNWSDFYC
jgi:translation initiation factor IF-3